MEFWVLDFSGLGTVWFQRWGGIWIGLDGGTSRSLLSARCSSVARSLVYTQLFLAFCYISDDIGAMYMAHLSYICNICFG